MAPAVAREHLGSPSDPGWLLWRRRKPAAEDRALAAADRRMAAADRLIAARERTQAALDRAVAERARAEVDLYREASAMDDLTGVYRRRAGLERLQSEIDRARRRNDRLMVAFLDVDGLKLVNDVRGHIAGDALLVAVAEGLRSCLRSYDVIMRFGGDEFVCVLPNADAVAVESRFAEVGDALASGPIPGSITAGFAELDVGDSPMDIVARADAQLLKSRRSQRRSAS